LENVTMRLELANTKRTNQLENLKEQISLKN